MTYHIRHFSLLIIVLSLIKTVCAQAIDASMNLHQPNTYAFIAAKDKPTLEVVDINEQKSLGTLAINSIADQIAINQKAGKLFYAQNNSTRIHHLDLSTQQTQAFSTSQPIAALMSDDYGNWVAYTSSSGMFFIDLSTGEETPISTEGALSALYNATLKQLFIAELDQGRLLRITITQNSIESVTTLFDLNAPMTSISMMPNGIALFFVSNHHLQRYSLLNETLSTIQPEVMMQPLRPYMSSDGRSVFTLSTTKASEEETQLIATNAYTYKIRNRYPLPDWQTHTNENRDFMRTGWLEKIAVLTNVDRLYSIKLKKPESLSVISQSPQPILSTLVTSDSKKFLFIHSQTSELGIMLLKTRTLSESIPLNTKNPAAVFMIATNTVCH